MVTIKAYTDLSQSKILSKILPLESADMGWYYSRNPQAARNQMWLGTKAENADIPCWSLAALLDVLPIVDLCIPTLKMKLNHKYYMELCIDCANYKYISTNDYDSPVDACYEIILKLHELKML